MAAKHPNGTRFIVGGTTFFSDKKKDVTGAWKASLEEACASFAKEMEGSTHRAYAFFIATNDERHSDKLKGTKYMVLRDRATRDKVVSELEKKNIEVAFAHLLSNENSSEET